MHNTIQVRFFSNFSHIYVFNVQFVANLFVISSIFIFYVRRFELAEKLGYVHLSIYLFSATMPSVPGNLPVDDCRLQSPCSPLSRSTMNPSQMTDIAMDEGRRRRNDKRKVFTDSQCVFIHALLLRLMCEDVSFGL